MKYLHKTKNFVSKINNSSGQIRAIIIFLVLVSFCLFIASFAVSQSSQSTFGLVGGSYLIPLVVIGGFIACIIAFTNTDWALIILILSMLLSPEIEIFQLPVRAVTIRLEDIFVILIFFGWLAKMAINKQWGFFRKTPINLPISLYVFISILATLRGIMLELVSPLSSVFFLLKYIEYMMIFFLVANNIKSLKQIKRLIFFSLLVCVIVSIYGIQKLIVSGFNVRAVTAPFDDQIHPETSTVAGYLLFFMGITGGLFLYSDSIKRRMILLGIFFLAIFPFIFSLTRGAWLGFIPMYLVLLLLGKRMRMPLFALLAISIILLPHMKLPTSVQDRVKYTFEPGVERKILGRNFIVDTSSAARIDSWTRQMIDFFPKYPLLGTGATGIGLADSQYFRVLGEVGLIGFLIFAWLMVSIFRVAYKNFKTIDDIWGKGLSLGFLAGFVGLLVQAFTANVFIIVRIMEPFMFMTAVMTTLNELFTPTTSLQEIT